MALLPPLFVVVPGVPIATVTASAATWRGTSMAQRAFATLRSQGFQGRGNGRFSLLQGQSQRIGSSKGTIDADFRMGSGAATVVLAQSSYSSVSAPLITLGVNSAGQAVGSIQDVNGTTVAAWAATTLSTVARTGVIHMQVAWDAAAAIDGIHHVWVIVNGVRMPRANFTTAPITAWTPFQALYITTGIYCETGFDGEMRFTQAIATAAPLVPEVLRPVDVEASLTLPSPSLQLSGTITPTVSLVGTLTLPSLQLSGALQDFRPTDVPEVAAGYFWEPSNTTGFGTTGFRVLEGNGHSSFDLIQATTTKQPTLLTENGGVQFRMRKTGDAVGLSNLSTAGDVQAGWTGPTYIGMWLRLPDGAGVLTSSTTTFFQHFNVTGNQKRIALGTNNNITTTSDRVTVVASPDGVNGGTSATYDTPFDGGISGGPAAAAYVWYEAIIDPALALGGSVAADKRKLFFNFVLQTQTIAPDVDTTGLFDASAPIVICSRPGGLGQGDTTDWAACYYANGIPSLANRNKLANYRNPSGVVLA